MTRTLKAVVLVSFSTTALAAVPPPPTPTPASDGKPPAVVSWSTYAVEPTQKHPEWDAEYTRRIREATTGPQFLTDLVDHLRASNTVPSPLKFLGYIAGAPDHLTYAEDVYAYMRAVERASKRVKVFTIGKSEEGREMIAVAISDEATIASLGKFREITRKLADPRTISDSEARALIAAGKPIYYATGAMHSPETGSPEMLMELAYRLAVGETAMLREIRANVITLITPVIEVDGRDRQVDLVRWKQANPDRPMPPLVYWGHYVAHDNNRDQIGLALALSRNITRTFMEWHPQVIHDLHESIPFLYVSTGTGPYNAWLDPLMIDEFTRMANHEVQELTRKGLPGVWTQGFYDGWAPNYMFWVGMGRNAIGRFYETFGNRVPSTEDRVVRDMSTRQWFRPNPPLPTVRWALRNNVNYQESGLLLALSDMASHREHFLEQFWEFGKRSIAKARNEGPAAYVFDGAQKRRGQLRDLMNLLRSHGIEVHVAESAFSIDPKWPPTTAKDAPNGERADAGKAKEEKPKDPAVKFAAGSFIVRMDQPYSRLADALLDTQFVRGDERVYDDTGWTLGFAKNLEFKRLANADVLGVPMRRWNGPPAPVPPAFVGAALAIENVADTDLARLVFALPKTRFLVTDEAIKGEKSRLAGTVLVALDDPSHPDVASTLGSLNLNADPLAAMPAVKTHELRRPRLALLHSWSSTQEEGWFRLALENLQIPYTYVSTQALAGEPDLRAKYDVILFPPVGRGTPQDLVNGMPPGPPLPWRKTELTPNLGVDETADMRPGMGLAGVASLQRFVQAGGLLITVEDTSRWAVHYGFAPFVRVTDAPKLKAPGTLIQARVVDRASPVAAGYDEMLPVYFGDGPVFNVGMSQRGERGDGGARPSGRGGKGDPDVPQGHPFVPLPERPKPAPSEEGFQPPEDMPQNSEAYMPKPEDRPRVIVAFAKEADKLLLSGMLEGTEELAGKPVVIDAPLGKGHVLLFAANPMWRMNTQGTWALITNALLNFDHLGPEAQAKK